MTTQNPFVATILGSSFSDSLLADSNAEEILIKTPYGDQVVFYLNLPGRRSYALYRHGIPHRLFIKISRGDCKFPCKGPNSPQKFIAN